MTAPKLDPMVLAKMRHRSSNGVLTPRAAATVAVELIAQHEAELAVACAHYGLPVSAPLLVNQLEANAALIHAADETTIEILRRRLDEAEARIEVLEEQARLAHKRGDDG